MNGFIRKRGFTDRLYFGNLALTWVFVWACYFACLFSGKLGVTDTNTLSVAVEFAFGQLTIHTSFVVWKAKVENCRKNKQDVSINIE